MSSPTHPNILLIMTDQLRADCIAALGNSKIKTPNIDRLVHEGTSFDRCFTPSPVCCPARQSLTSGLPPHQTGCVDNVDSITESQSFIQVLANQGYQTHGIGKMHFSPNLGDWGFSSRDVSEEFSPPSTRDDYRTFLDENGYEHVLDPHGLRSEFYYVPQPSQVPEKLHHSHWVADGSIDFLNRRDTSKPFFLWSSFIKPHPPFESPNPWGRLYRMHEMDEPLLSEGSGEHWTFWNKVQNRYKYVDDVASNRNLARSIKAAYYGTISFIDYNVGRILDALGSEIDNTLIVFTSDHGELLGDFGCYGKRSMLDPSARVPMIARLPGSFPGNYRCDTPTTLLDLFPTFTSLGGSHADSPSPEGISLLEAMDNSAKDRIVYSQFSQNDLGLYMAANRKWKYIYSAADDKEWLFELANDPYEIVNRKDDPSCLSQFQKLKDACIQRFKSDGYFKPLDGNDWKHFTPPIPPIPNSDDGQLFQDPDALEKQIEALGIYARSTEFTKDKRFGLLDRLFDASRQPSEAITD
ncbi:MAG: sulfatase-like hydrolase/transferase [Opitutales bacterium]|nr:sulfatase-like hydrolase/transferase [Opitutales bacterium]